MAFGDESHIIYVNSQIQDETELGKLMHDFSCRAAEDMHYKILAERVRYFKEDKKGVAVMSRIMEEFIDEEIFAERKNMAERMLRANKFTCEEIAEYSGLPVADVEALASKKSA